MLWVLNGTPSLPSLSCSWKSQPCPSAPGIAMGLTCYHHSFTSLKPCLEFGKVGGLGWEGLPVQVSRRRTGNDPPEEPTSVGCLLPHRKLLLPGSHILAGVTARWGLSVIQDLH